MKQWHNFFLDLLFPKFCLNCGCGNEFICKECFKKIKLVEFETCPVCEGRSLFGFTHPGCYGKYRLDGMTVGADYRDPIIKKIIHRFKYQGKTAVAAELIEKLLLSKLHVSVPYFDFLTYIPLHPDKERKRGFNQSEILAREIGKRLNLPVVNLLKRTVYTIPQMKITKAEERRENVRGIFSFVGTDLPQHHAVRGRLVCPHAGRPGGRPLRETHIALVDDVSTTGATLFEACRVLKHNGANFVWGIVLARKQREN